MKQKANRTRTIYDDSLPRIFLWSGFTVFVILLIACVIIGAVIFFSHYNLDEGRKIILACLALAVPGSYGLPLISLIKVWNQERALGIYWKDRTDQERPEWERDWYLSYERGGFILIHRAYIQCITGSKEELEDTGSYAKGSVYHTAYEDINGTRHLLNFSSESGSEEFQKWYKKQPFNKENRDDEQQTDIRN